MIRPIQQDYLISHIVDKITGFLIEDFQLDIPSALNIVYTSDTFRALSDKETDLYSQSPSGPIKCMTAFSVYG